MTSQPHTNTQVATLPLTTVPEIQLEVNNIEVVYHDIIQVLRGVSLSIPKGKIVSLLGTNGAGKTTTLRAISGLLKPENGQVKEGYVAFEGQQIHQKTGQQIVKTGIVQVPEGRHVFKHLSIEENLKVGSITRSNAAEVKQDLQKVYEIFPKLYTLRHRQAGYTSGGEQQMVAIGRALMAAPKLLMLDEPSLGLAPLLVKEIFERIKAVNSEGTTILVVEQNANIALGISDYGYIMEQGRIVLEGKASDLRNNPDVKEFYMGMGDEGKRKSFKQIKAYKRRKRWM
ncbi:MAG: ABC transporter ATP-binding protein [Deinococcales bacterium]